MASSSRTSNRRPGGRRPRPRDAAPPPMRDESGRTRATGRVAVLALVLLALVISYASSLRAWIDQRHEIATVEAEIAAAEQRVDELEQTKQRWHDDAYLRKMARERFGWVLPGEIGYRVIDEDGDTVGATPRLDAPPDGSGPPDEPDWYDRVWGSVLWAGQDPADPDAEPEPTRPSDTVIKQRTPGSDKHRRR
jgi:cell division protein FtsB